MRFLLSIIVPVYNTSQYLHACLESVIAQTFQDIEIICINDGSTDDSLLILKEFQKRDARIIIIDQQNKGVSAARNVGVGMATGKYILFLDSDDLLAADAFSEIANELICSNMDLLLCNFSYLGYNNQVLNSDNKKKNYNELGTEKIITDYIKWNLKIIMGSFFIRNTFLKEHNLNFNIGQSYAEDVEFNVLALYYAENVKVLSQNINFYRTNPNSAVAQINYKRFESFFSRQKLHRFFKDKNGFEDLVKIYEGYLLPEAVITVVELFAKRGHDFFKLMKFLKDHNMFDHLAANKFNSHTPSRQRIIINKFRKSPFLFFISKRFQEINYQVKVYLYNKIKKC